MKNTVIVYESLYGSTKKYAATLAEVLDADIFESTKILAKDLIDYKTIVFGGGLYSGSILGIKKLTNNYIVLKDKNLIVFTVGITLTNNIVTFKPTNNKTLSKLMRESINFFHLRGGIDYNKLTKKHKLMMKAMNIVLRLKSKKNLTKNDIELLSTYNKNIDLIDKNTLKPIIDLVKKFEVMQHEDN